MEIETSSSPIWMPRIPNPPPGEGSGGGSSGLLSGFGPPDNSLGNNGNLYVNKTNGDVYSKAGDVWIVSGGASGENLMDNGSPLNVVTPDAEGQFYTELDAVPLPKLWQAEGVTSADWRERT